MDHTMKKNKKQNYICQICKKEFNNKQKYLKHVKANRCKNILLGHKILTKQFIEENLKVYSANYIAKVICKKLGYNCTAQRIIDMAEKYNIKTYTISESKKLPSVIQQTKKTCLQKYGTQSQFSKNSTSRLKWEKRLFEEQGITNVFQRKEVIEKIQQTNIKKYGVKYYTLTKQYNQLYKNHGRLSKIHKQISNVLNQLHIIHKNEQIIKINDKVFIVDILCENNVVIEIYGDRWHLNPLIYKENDLINHLWLNKKYGPLYARDVWKIQNEKILILKQNNYYPFIIWQYDIKHNFNFIKEQIIEIKEKYKL